MSKIIAFDLDDTLCFRDKKYEHLGPNKYEYCEPIQDMIDICNKLYDEGNVIIIYTARGMNTFDSDVTLIYENLYDLTVKHLNKWGVKFNQLIMGKIHYDVIIDDKAYEITTVKEKFKI